VPILLSAKSSLTFLSCDCM